MDTTHRQWIRALTLLLLVAVPTAFVARYHLRLEIDSQNRSMKSVGTREAADIAQRIRSFGSDQEILLAFEAAPALALTANQHNHIRAVADRVRRVDGVRFVAPLPTEDRSVACLAVGLPSATANERVGQTVAAVRTAARAAMGPELRLRATGQPLFEAAIAHEINVEQGHVVPWIVGTLGLLLVLYYRSLWIPLLILLPAGCGILWTGGLLQLCGYQLNPILVLLDPLLLTVGVAGSVHVVECYLRQRPMHGPETPAAVREELWRPMMLTTLTSLVGFLSLVINPIPAVRTFGVFAGVGVAVTSALALWAVPTWMAPFTRRAESTSRTRFALHFAAWMRARSGRILFVSAILLSTVILHGAPIRVDNDPMKVLSAEAELRRDTDWIADHLGGIESVDLVFPREVLEARPGLAQTVAVELGAQPEITGVQPTAVRAADGDVLVRATLRPGGSVERVALFDRVEEFVADLGAPEVHATGTAVQIARDSMRLIQSQLWSLVLVVPLLAACVALGLKSLRLGMLSLIPNALPCLLLQGAMAALDRPLSVATVMIGTVMMGLIVDDTIHLLHGYDQARKRGQARPRAVGVALRRAARPITVTSIVLVAGFGVGAFGELTTTVEFSILASCTIALAWVLDILVLPALLIVEVKPRPPRMPKRRYA